MHQQDMPLDTGKSKADHTSLYTVEWQALSQRMTLEERGFAISVLAFMFTRGWREIPPAETIAERFSSVLDLATAHRLRPVLEGVPRAARIAQLERLCLWPAWLVGEFAS